MAELDGSCRPARGLHHITTVVGDVQRTADFYAHILGLKRVKKTVCYDDPGSYHLYFGDNVGSPGTVISTLAWRCVAKGMVGVGEVVQTAFRVPAGSSAWWSERLKAANVACRLDHSVFGEAMLCFVDPDGTALALVESKRIHREAERSEDLQAVMGLNEVTLNVRREDATVDILQDVLGFKRVSKAEDSIRFVAHDGPGGTLTLRTVGASSRGRLGGGTIRHVAFRAADTEDQSGMIQKLQRMYGIAVTEPIERTYLTAVGFRAPCGVLFEIATDGPGFAVDEARDRLGEGLKLPGFLEQRRPELQSILPPLN
ncbi:MULTISPECIES: ring-cleaving dioxygenase [Bradyrhizobium]|uniref:Glyoxalase family protein n=2 Tax=Bradyrhizobium TaxID=374 RepID=A0ABY0P947_9BRAD|nr:MULTISPECIES: ring-cleaving dioxygenase [Bradyrhizobium]SDH72971.1 glyoxalase family protein [Bradyrhizobium ottawaense]SEE11369.1 glyoxalase family protein [Bradyrhizobium lablabi]SHM07218.1 glyoxalase family protein [Bradyrhizobium lablabi]